MTKKTLPSLSTHTFLDMFFSSSEFWLLTTYLTHTWTLMLLFRKRICFSYRQCRLGFINNLVVILMELAERHENVISQPRLHLG